MTQIGFLGMGIMGEPMVRNIKKSNKFEKVVVWNRNGAKCQQLVSEGCVQASTAADVVRQCDITIAMVSDPEAAKAVALGPDGVVDGISKGKAYVDMSTVDAGTSSAIAAAVREKGGRFLEAPVAGSKQPAIDGKLIILAAGDKSVHEDMQDAFGAMGKSNFYLGEVGAGARMKLVVNMMMGTMLGTLSEGLCLAEKSDLSVDTLLEILAQSPLNNPMFTLKAPAMIKRDFPTAFPLKHAQKDMRLALLLGDEVAQPLNIASAANEVMKRSRQLGYGDHDFSSIHEAIKGEDKK